jgi:hypothetical protein
MATTYNLFIDQGSDFVHTFTVKDSSGTARSLANLTGRAQIRRSYFSSSNVAFVATIDDATSGNIKISLTNAQTANLRYGRYVYDIELVNTLTTANVERVFQGIATIYPEVTKA